MRTVEGKGREGRESTWIPELGAKMAVKYMYFYLCIEVKVWDRHVIDRDENAVYAVT